ncbi:MULTISPECIES: zinc-dependent alcohol dehydrogenase family protein [Rhizobium]|uniref:Zinc-dependent alcohol dehydrogenase family protein n=1 Tax=Rhizobium rhododendri TaxID=2506430 RepID=A0ABY8ICJ2_9HYPH|nr:MULTISPECIES: zinc-dependent alcohol dehydrogenase family protein [Rhizobium]TQX92061.1 iditol 2-dehydrogenase [Rhizobium sp. rho-13.1]TQY18436.1 iditol 2-dehydrogenase [Rhizobium sp. rho-1.1]WFS21464.1 zinc-dependent alcohol dehydrogenase family protein [Rhizobium rhododendri]
MQAIRLDAVGQLTVSEIEKPVPGRGELLVRVEACGICGTDRHILHGEFPSAPPVTLGHEFAGIVEAVGADTTGFAPGMRVTCDPNISCGLCSQCRSGRVNLCERLQAIGIHRDGGFADYAILPVTQAFELPLGLDPLHGAFCEPLACCLHGVDMAKIETGASVVVLGGGVIGLLVVQLARLAGATRVVLITRHKEKRALAERLGATATLDPGLSDPIAAISGPDGLLPGGADVVFECAGVAETVQQSTRMAKSGGTVVILGVMPQGQTVPIEPFDLLFRELKFIGSFINPFTHRRAADLIASGAVDVAPLISRVVGMTDGAEAIRQPARPGEIRVLVVPDHAAR